MNELALFAGAGGGILGGKLLGWRTVCAVEIEPYAASVLVQRQNDGILPPFPIWDDIRTFDGKPWRGLVDVVSGGFPCQDISCAGTGKGIDGERSGLWKEMSRIICEVRPRFVLVENSPLLTRRGLFRVLGDLAEMGYDARWGVLGAIDVGAPHKRDRIWIVAYPRKDERVRVVFVQDDAEEKRNWDEAEWSKIWNGFEMGPEDYTVPRLENEICESNSDGMADGVADWVDRLACTGNGQVPAVVRLAWNVLSGGIVR